MNRKDFGKLVVALRREHVDPHFNRWTRQKFVEECQKVGNGFVVDEQVLANIENGRRVNLSPDLLSVMATALKLTAGERKEFFFAAIGLDEKAVYSSDHGVVKVLHNLLAIMEQFQAPAFLSDSYWDIVAVNRALVAVYGLNIEDVVNSKVDPMIMFNMMRILFSPEFEEQKKILGQGWEKFAINACTLFRTSSLRHRGDDYFQVLYPKLCEFDDFKVYVQRRFKAKEDYLTDNMLITLDNPNYGTMNTVTTSLMAVTPIGELQLSIFTPLGEETNKIFATICKEGNQVFSLLPDWPEHRVRVLQSSKT